MDFKQAVGSTIQRVRREHKYTQEKLAHHANISVSSLSLIERGENSPSLYTVFAIAKAMDIPASDLVKQIEAEDPEVDYIEMY